MTDNAENKEQLPAVEKKSMLKAAESRYRDTITELVTRKSQMMGADLQWKWDVGKVAATIANEEYAAVHERTYGSHVMEDVAKAVGEATESVRYLIRFYQNTDEKLLHAYIKKNWPWRGITALLRIHDAEERKAMQLAWEAGEYKNTDELMKAVVSSKDEARADGRENGKGGKGLLQPIKTATANITRINGEVLPEVITQARIYAEKGKDADDGQWAKITERASDLREQLALVKQMTENVESALKSIGL